MPRGRPRGPQRLALLLAAAVALLSARGALASCTKSPCLDPRPYANTNTYCLVSFANDCAYTSGSNTNSGCEPCTLWVESTTACKAPTGLDVQTCKKGFVVRKDKCANPDNKWKIYPSKKPYVGVETIKNDPNGKKFNFMFKGLWDSALTGANPCSATMTWASSPSIAMMENAVQYRTKHLMHAHIGGATAEFRKCVDDHIKAATKAKTWTQELQCTFTNRNVVGQVPTWVWLQGPVKTTARPNNVGSIVNKVFKGPLAGVTDEKSEYTGFGVTTATWNNKNYFAVLVYNYMDAHKAPATAGYQVGEYELIRGG